MKAKYQLALGALLTTLVGCSRPEAAPATLPAQESHEPPVEEIAQYMAAFQRYTDKLYLSGQAGNAELARHYLHELEETAESLEKAGLKEDEHDLGQYAKLHLLPRIAQLEKQLEQPDWKQWDAHYDMLIAGCNSCHQSTAHSFIRIQRPAASAFPGQDFSPRMLK